MIELEDITDTKTNEALLVVKGTDACPRWERL
jgi:hypothetical protein